MKLALTLLIGLVVAMAFTGAQWMQARRLRRSKSTPNRASRQYAG